MNLLQVLLRRLPTFSTLLLSDKVLVSRRSPPLDGLISASEFLREAGGVSDVSDLTTTGLTTSNFLRVKAGGGLEQRTPTQARGDMGAMQDTEAAVLARIGSAGLIRPDLLPPQAGGSIIISVSAPEDTTATWIDPEGWIESVYNGAYWISKDQEPSSATYFYWGADLFTWQDGEEDPVYVFTWAP